MAAFEVIALDTATPQLRAPGAADTYTFPRAVSMSGALTYGGVTLNNAVTGTGNMVLSVSPTFTTPVLGTPSSGTLTNCTGLPLSTGVTGTLPVANGGTGQTSYTDGQLLIGNTTGGTLAKATLTAGSNITITNGPGSITIAASGGGGSSALTISNKTAAYTVVSGDLGTIINCTSGTFTVSLTAAATLGAGFNCWIWNTGTGTITIDPNGAETIDGNATFVLRKGQGVQIICTGTAFRTGAPKQYYLYNEDYDNTIGGRPTANNSLGAIALHYGAVATGNTSMAIGFSTSASGENASAIGYRASASGPNSTGLGANSAYQGSQAITGNGAMALGGSYASGTDSFAAAVANNTSSYGATGNNSVAIGRLSRATSTQSFAFGSAVQATASYSIALGWSATSNSNYAVAIGDSTNASEQYAYAFGLYSNSNKFGKYAYASGRFATTGDAQTGLVVLRAQTTDATATVLRSNNSAVGTSNQVILDNNSAFAFTGTVVARRQASGGTESAAWKIEGLIRREGTAASTTLVASTVTAISNAPGWTLALSADTTNGGLTITATGAAATNIQWVATVQTSEVIYA